MVLVKTCKFFLHLFSVRKEYEIRFNNVLNRKETFFDWKSNNFSMSQKWHFSLAFGQKMPNFCLFRFGRNKLEIRLSNFVEKKQTFFDY